MIQKMRAKFQCDSNDGDENSKTAKLSTQYSDNPEDNMFNEATPWGNIEMGIDKAGAMNFLQPGKSYYVDFTEAEEVQPVKAGPDDIPMDEDQIEEMIQEKGLNAPRLTPEMIDAKIKDATYTNLPSGKCVICEITLQNGFTVRGESACVSPENFDQEIGNNISFKNARDKIWQLEGYLLQQNNPC